MYLAQFKDVMVLVLYRGADLRRAAGRMGGCGHHPAGGIAQRSAGRDSEKPGRKIAGGAEKAVLTPRRCAAEAIISVPASDLVPGDVVLLEAGDYVSPICALRYRQGCAWMKAPSPAKKRACGKAR